MPTCNAASLRNTRNHGGAIDLLQKMGPRRRIPFRVLKVLPPSWPRLDGRRPSRLSYRVFSQGNGIGGAQAGGEDSTVLISRYGLACLLFNAGRVQEALDEHQKVLEARIEVCGKNAQFTLKSHEAMGILLHLEGRNAEVEQVNDTHLRLPWSTVCCLILTPRTGKSLSAVSIGTIEATGQLKVWLELSIGTQRC